ncbi:MAG TPA: hypothetical protein VKZ63_17825 [Kofleriaceae bacterium]|nr:hypothetical protein [Kofleriaceae bacterium]
MIVLTPRRLAVLLAIAIGLAGLCALEGGGGEAEAARARAQRAAARVKHERTRATKAQRRAARQKKAKKKAAARPRAAASLSRPAQRPAAAELSRRTGEEPAAHRRRAAPAGQRAAAPARAPRGRARARAARPVRTASASAARQSRPPVVLDATRNVTLAEAAQTTAVRETFAMRAVAERLRVRGGPSWEVSTPFEQFVGDASNPVTGSGPIEVLARQKVTPRGLWARIRHSLSPSSERRFMVLVDPKGQATILSSQPNSFPYRAARYLTQRIPLRELVADGFRSAGVRNGIGMSVGGVGVAAATGPMGWIAGGALIYRGVNMMVEGVGRRRVARKQAMTRTVAAIRRAIKRGETVTLPEAYRTYTRRLEDLKSGTTPLELRSFAEELSTYGL